MKTPTVFGHRGASGDYPENTLLSFRNALKAGAHAIESDIRLTRDGIPVLFHDKNLKRTTGIDKKIDEIPFESLRTIDCGAMFTKDGGKSFPFRGRGIRVPALDEFLAEFPDTHINLEIKDGTVEAIKAALDVLKKRRALDRALIASFSTAPVFYVRENYPVVATSATKGEVLDFLFSIHLKKRPPSVIKYDALQIPPTYYKIKILDNTLIFFAKNAGVTVHAWTINSRETAERLLSMGVDGIMSDYPKMVLDVLKEL